MRTQTSRQFLPRLTSRRRFRASLALSLGLVAGAAHFGTHSARAAVNTWTGATDASWETASDWSLGTVPTSSDIALWDNTSTANLTITLNASESVLGLRVGSPSAAVILNEPTGGTNTLTIGSSGIDLSAATRNMTINTPIVLGSAQTWSVAAGRVLTIGAAGAGAISGTGPVSIVGPGQVRLGGLAATYTATGGFSVSGGSGANNVTATGSNPNSASLNLFLDLGAIYGTVTGNLNLPALTVGGGFVNGLAGTPGGSGQIAYQVTANTFNINAGNTSFTQQRGTGSRMIFNIATGTTAVVSRAVGGTVSFRTDIGSSGNENGNGGGYRMSTGNNTAAINGVVPFITLTTATSTSTSSNSIVTSWFVPVNGNNGTPYTAFTSSTATSLGTATNNSTVVTDTTLTGANPVNTIRFADTTGRTVTMGSTDSLTIGAGGMLITGAAAHTITGGTLAGGNPGSGSGNDLIVFQYNTATPFTINSNIVDGAVNPTTTSAATALTKSGNGILTLTGANTYTGATFVNAGTLLVNGSISSASAATVNTGGTLAGAGGTVAGTVAVNRGGTLLAGSPTAVGNLTTGAVTLNAGSTFSAVVAGDASFSQLLATTTSAAGAFSITLLGTPTFAGTGEALTLIPSGFSGTFTNGSFTVGGYIFTADYLTTPGGFAVDVTASAAVPEPSTWISALMCGVTGMVVCFRRVRKSRI